MSTRECPGVDAYGNLCPHDKSHKHDLRGSRLKPTTMDRVLELLHEAGWVDDGRTQTEHVRIPTTKVPAYLFGGQGGELRTLGGRLRLAKPGTDRKVTVGKRTTYFYEIREGVVRADLRVQTKDLERIQNAAL